jgi:hypothetical protein
MQVDRVLSRSIIQDNRQKSKGLAQFPPASRKKMQNISEQNILFTEYRVILKISVI